MKNDEAIPFYKELQGILDMTRIEADVHCRMLNMQLPTIRDFICAANPFDPCRLTMAIEFPADAPDDYDSDASDVADFKKGKRSSKTVGSAAQTSASRIITKKSKSNNGSSSSSCNLTEAAFYTLANKIRDRQSNVFHSSDSEHSDSLLSGSPLGVTSSLSQSTIAHDSEEDEELNNPKFAVFWQIFRDRNMGETRHMRASMNMQLFDKYLKIKMEHAMNIEKAQ